MLVSLVPAAISKLYQSQMSTWATKIDEASLEEKLATIAVLILIVHLLINVTTDVMYLGFVCICGKVRQDVRLPDLCSEAPDACIFGEFCSQSVNELLYQS